MAICLVEYHWREWVGGRGKAPPSLFYLKPTGSLGLSELYNEIN